MEDNSVEKEFKSLFIKYIFHIIIFTFIFMTHIIIYRAIYWDKNIIKLLFFYFSMIQIIYILIPIISFVLIKLNHFNSKIEGFKIIGKVFLVISIIIGIFFSLIIIINTIYGKEFRNECPFNLSNDFYLKFDEYFSGGGNENDNELKDKCQEKRCISIDYNEDSKYPYKYLCNYNPQEYFSDKLGEPYSRTLSNGTELKTYNMIECTIIGPIYNNNFNNEKILDYFNICYFLTDFHYCERFEEPKQYNIENIKECPDKNYIFIHGFLCVYIIIFDIFISFIPWLVENNSYNSLLVLIDEEFNDNNKINNNNINNNKIINGSNSNNKLKKNNSKTNPIKTSTNIINNNDNQNNNNNNQLKNKSSLHHTKWTSIISDNELNFKKEKTKFLDGVTKSNNNEYINNKNDNKNNNIDNNNNNNNIINNFTNNNNNIMNENSKKNENLTDNYSMSSISNNVKTYKYKNIGKVKEQEEEENEEENEEVKDEEKSIDISNRNIDKNKIYENNDKNNIKNNEEEEIDNNNNINIKKFILKSSSFSIN